jgi:hypothetical protein
MRRTRAASPRLLIAAAATALLALPAACGHTASVPADRVLRMALTEYRIIPQSVRAKQGQLMLIVENDGRLTHNLAIAGKGTILGQTPPIPPGHSADLFVTLSAGSYLMTSTLFSDQALGEYGTLTVIP